MLIVNPFMFGVAALSVTASSVIGSANGPDPTGTVNSASAANANPTGGVSPYSFAWTRISGDTPTIIAGETTASPLWQKTGVVNGFPSVSVWRVTVTDDDMNTATKDITVTLEWSSTS